MKVVLAAYARSDLIRIGDFIALDNPGRARSFVLDLRKACVSLRDNPTRYSYLSGFENRGLRRRPVGNYLIIYDVGTTWSPFIVS
jgi:toxin ParE1/3/4